MPFQPSPNTASFSYRTQTQQNPKFNSINPVPVLPIPTALPRGQQSCRSVRTSATLCHSANASGVMYSFMGMCRLLGRRYCPNVTTSHPTALRSLRVASTSAGVSPTPSISDVFVITCEGCRHGRDAGRGRGERGRRAGYFYCVTSSRARHSNNSKSPMQEPTAKQP